MLVLHTIEVRQSAQTLLISSRDAESALRNFLLSGDPEELRPFEGALGTAHTELEKLRTLASDNSVQQTRLKTLDGLLRTKTERLNKGVAFAREGQRDAALAIINSQDGRDLISGIRDEIESVLDTERDLLTERQERAADLRYVLAALIGVALLAAVILAGTLAVSTRDALRGLLVRTSELEAEFEASTRG